MTKKHCTADTDIGSVGKLDFISGEIHRLNLTILSLGKMSTARSSKEAIPTIEHEINENLRT